MSWRRQSSGVQTGVSSLSGPTASPFQSLPYARTVQRQVLEKLIMSRVIKKIRAWKTFPEDSLVFEHSYIKCCHGGGKQALPSHGTQLAFTQLIKRCLRPTPRGWCMGEPATSSWLCIGYQSRSKSLWHAASARGRGSETAADSILPTYDAGGRHPQEPWDMLVGSH